jgi:hypothetical protein
MGRRVNNQQELEMASTQQNGNKTAARNPSTPGPNPHTPPPGMQKTAMSVDQFWDETRGPIYGKLIAGKSYINKASKRVSTIYVFQLSSDSNYRTFTKTSDGEPFKEAAEPGSLVGVWGCPGMRELDTLADCIVWMARNGEKDLGRAGQKPMRVYDVRFRGAPKALAIVGTGNDDALAGNRPAADQAEDEPF